MGYYREQRKAFQKIGQAIAAVIMTKSSINIDNFVIQLTESLEYGERGIIKRIEKIVSNNPNLEIKNGEIKYVGE